MNRVSITGVRLASHWPASGLTVNDGEKASQFPTRYELINIQSSLLETYRRYLNIDAAHEQQALT
jgi:hypothetical protein